MFTRERLLELLPVMAHWAKGGKIQICDLENEKWEDYPAEEFPEWSENFQYRIKPEPEFVPFEAKDIRPDWILRKNTWSETEWTRPIGVGVFGVELSIETGPNRVSNFELIGFEDLNKNWLFSPDNGRTWLPCRKEKV